MQLQLETGGQGPEETKSIDGINGAIKGGFGVRKALPWEKMHME